jgi:hypothetical protein
VHLKVSSGIEIILRGKGQGKATEKLLKRRWIGINFSMMRKKSRETSGASTEILSV